MTRRARLIEALVAEIWGRTVSVNGAGAEYQHFWENDLEGPPLLLERLGYMTRPPSVTGHSFAEGWQPGDAPPFSKSSPPVTEDALLDALFFMDRWRGDADSKVFQLFYGRALQPVGPDVPMPSPPVAGAPANDANALAFRRWAAGRIKSLIA